MKPLTLSVLTLILTAPLACSQDRQDNRAPASAADAQAFDKRGDVQQDVPGAAPLGSGGTTSSDVNGTDVNGDMGATGGTGGTVK
jgi:hypothetical protein